MSTEETPCPNREDKTHCVCWWEGEPCCACGDAAMTEDEKRDTGMPEVDAPAGCGAKAGEMCGGVRR